MSTEALPSAAVSLEEIVATDPSSALYLPLAERLLSRGQVSEAVRLCEERRSRPGKGVGDHIVLGRCYLADGRLDQAREQFQAALVLDRENVVALKSMAGILSHDGRHAEAADLYRAVCRVDAGDLESQSALHQITSGDYPEVRPPEVIVSQGDLRWQPVRLTREEDHLSELGLGLRTFETLDAGSLRPTAPLAGIAPPSSAPATTASGMPANLPWPVEPEEMILTPEDLTIGPRFPHEAHPEPPKVTPLPRRPEVVVPAGAVPDGGLHNRLGSLDVEEFQVSALERIEDALRPVEIRELGEVSVPEASVDEAPAAEVAPAAPVAAPIASKSQEEPRQAPTRSAVWGEEPAGAVSSPPAATRDDASSDSAAGAPSTVADSGDPAAAPRPIVEGNRTAFETWLRRLGGR